MQLTTDNYSEARSHISDGDMIALRSRHSLLAKMTRLLLNTPYTHTSIALWLDNGLWCAEMGSSGNMLVPLSQYRDTAFDVFQCPAPRMTVREQVLEHMRDNIEYDFWDLFRIWTSRTFGFPKRADDDEMVCSQFTAHVYLESGWVPKKLPALAAPSDVVDALAVPPHVEYRV